MELPKSPLTDPREIALRAQNDLHSHTHAIHVAFARLYRHAVPTPRIAAYYNSRLPAVRAWVAARLERENNLTEEQDESAQDGDMGDEDRDDGSEPGVEGEAEEPVTKPVATAAAAATTTRSKEKAQERPKSKDPRPPPRKRKAAAISKTPKATATAPAKTTVLITRSTATASTPEPARATRPKQRRTEVERLLLSRGAPILTSLPPATPQLGSTDLPINLLSPSPPPSAPSNLTPSPPPPPSKPRADPKKPHTATIPANTKTKRTPTTNPKPNPQPADSLPHTPFVTEVLVNRYPLPVPRRKRGDEGNGARIDLARLALMCLKAAGQTRVPVKGWDNAVGGGGALVFLRRNRERVRRRLAVLARR